MYRGYIKLWRKMTEWEWYKDCNTFYVFMHLLLKANYKHTRFMGYDIPSGSLVAGRKALAKECKLSERSIRTCLTKLKSTNEIAIKTTNRFSIISILRWEEYQVETTIKTTSKQSNKRPTSDQQATTSKEGKNIRIKEYTKNFDIFYKAYPKKIGKEKALKAWNKLKVDEDLFKIIMTALEAQKKSKDWEKDDGKFIPHPATWLNGKRWEDELKGDGMPISKKDKKLRAVE